MKNWQADTKNFCKMNHNGSAGKGEKRKEKEG